MFARLQRGTILKSEICQKGENFYTIILKDRWFLPGWYKTARLYKNWEDDSSDLEVTIREWDYTNYPKEILNGSLKKPNEEEIARLKENIDSLPEITRDKIYHGDKLEIFQKNPYATPFGVEIQKVKNINSPSNSNLESLSERLSNKVYKKALSIVNILPL
jgi:hypothetical protein